MSDWTFSPSVIDKARTLIAEGKVEEVRDLIIIDPPDRQIRSFQVVGSRPYRVRTDAAGSTASWITCTCPHGQHAGSMVAKCSHAVAVLITVKEEGNE